MFNITFTEFNTFKLSQLVVPEKFPRSIASIGSYIQVSLQLSQLVSFGVEFRSKTKGLPNASDSSKISDFEGFPLLLTSHVQKSILFGVVQGYA